MRPFRSRETQRDTLSQNEQSPYQEVYDEYFSGPTAHKYGHDCCGPVYRSEEYTAQIWNAVREEVARRALAAEQAANGASLPSY